MQIDLSWNLLLSGMLFPILMLMINKLSKNAEERSTRLNEKIDIIGQTLLDLQLDMGGKLGRTEHEKECRSRGDDIWERLNNHCHDIAGNVVIPRGK